MKLVETYHGYILDFDIENRPLSYRGNDKTTADITSIAWGWTNEKQIHVRLLGECTTEEIISDFLEYYEVADMVTGHYIRGHDLGIINSHMIELGMGKLPKKLASDTYLDGAKLKELPRSQKELAEMLGVSANKFDMSQHKWRRANRLYPDGLELTKKRVTDDVRQHKELREAMIEEGLLGPPRVWRP